MKKLQQEQREPEELIFIKGVQKLVPASMSTLRRWWRSTRRNSQYQNFLAQRG